MSTKLQWLWVALLASSCSLVQRVESAIDCNGICQRYASCFNAEYDVGECAARCRQSAADQPAFRLKAEECNTCIRSRSCVSATFACAPECLSVVP